MKIIVLGSNGMAGHMITSYLKNKGHEVVTVARNNADHILDVENNGALAQFFLSNNSICDYVINCIGVLSPDANKSIPRTIYINSWFPHFLEWIYTWPSTRVIHISTDCIFDGTGGYYVESDIPTETNIYGRSKALGEINNNKDITFRMSIIGTEIKKYKRSGLLNWVLTSPGKDIAGWDNCLWNGITTLQLAKCIEQYIEKPTISGIYHLVDNKVRTTKFELVSLINKVFEVGKTVSRERGPKPENKILVDTRQDIDFGIPDYETQLKELRFFGEIFY